MIPDGYVMPLVDGDLMIDLPQGILFVRLIEASLLKHSDAHDQGSLDKFGSTCVR
jgi:hypothetical protein